MTSRTGNARLGGRKVGEEGQLLAPTRKGATRLGVDGTQRAAMPDLNTLHPYFAPLRLGVES